MECAILYALAWILGTLFGSFVGVCIDRIPAGQSFVTGRSHCPACGHTLRAWELVPIVSYLALRGRCKSCSTRIPLQTMVVELLCGGLFVFALAAFGLSAKAGIMAAFYAVLLAIAFIDMNTMEIPNGAHFWIAAFAVLSAVFVRDVSLLERAIGLVCVSVPFLLIALATRGIGGGDIKLMAVAGLLLGWQGVAVSALLGIVIGAAAGIIYKARSGENKMPLGPFLAIGLVIGSVWADWLLSWYLSFF